MNLNPKERFQKNKEAAAEHAAIASNSRVLQSLDVALAEMALRLPSADSPNAYWSNAAKVEGAKTFINTWLSLSEPPMQRNSMASGLEPIPEPKKK